ncbi:hypothetical protein CEXT_642341 [Caerostris extrusa]|uniref:Uncharacterized protein n=1 Tax=Caerostris extrusa TaxID=172846 RepID=A0AAV4V7N5_CAEEX|nr:hypothetical protein CEXT_642341 [Caerostris extrusa]
MDGFLHALRCEGEGPWWWRWAASFIITHYYSEMKRFHFRRSLAIDQSGGEETGHPFLPCITTTEKAESQPRKC